MSTRRWLFAVGAVVLVVAAVAAFVLATTGGDEGRNTAGRSGVLPDESYALLWAGTRVGQSETAVLARWPKPPYQHYGDGLAEDCYEWEDQAAGPGNQQPAHLYNLCFKDGVLRLKTVF